MGINITIAVTDGNWYETLRQHPGLGEVNFWSPSKKKFQALEQGELFLFKLHAPHDYIVGGGIFDHFDIMPCSLAWKAFGVGNGAHSAEEMRTRIAKKKAGLDDRSDFPIGCRILTHPFFFDVTEWFSVPKSWKSNMYAYKTYNTDNNEGMDLWNKVNERLGQRSTPGETNNKARYGAPQLILQRLGQNAFRKMVTDNYERRCAVTQERTLPALEAAHIKPYSDGGTHEARNGLLLRSDIHRLFDAGYVTVRPNLKFEVSKRIKREFKNGRDYYALQGKLINVPTNPRLRPDRKALTWHNANCYER